MKLRPENSRSGGDGQTCQLLSTELDPDVSANQDPGSTPLCIYPTAVTSALLQGIRSYFA